MKCPDCRESLDIEATKCRCGWKAATTPGPYAVAGAPRPICRTVGCHEPAMNGHAHCRPCDERERQVEAEAFCRSKGLTTIEEKRAYCKKLLRTFGRGAGGFESWAANITQAGVDTLARLGTKSDEHVLDRLRSMGVVDGRNKLIPLEGRAVAAEAQRAERARQIAKVQEDLQRLAERFGTPLPAETEVKA